MSSTDILSVGTSTMTPLVLWSLTLASLTPRKAASTRNCPERSCHTRTFSGGGSERMVSASIRTDQELLTGAVGRGSSTSRFRGGVRGFFRPIIGFRGRGRWSWFGGRTRTRGGASGLGSSFSLILSLCSKGLRSFSLFPGVSLFPLLLCGSCCLLRSESSLLFT